MGAVGLVARRRLARRWRGLVAAGILLGLGFGVSFASLAAARRTASAYNRILVAADAPDAAVAHYRPLDESEKELRTIAGITAQRTYAGFRGVADGVDPVLTTALIAPARDRFPLELPVLDAGRLPDPEASDEVFVNDTVAKGADLEVGQRLEFHFFKPGSPRTADTTVKIVGVGTFPVEAVRDETMVLGVVVFTRAFYDTHRDLVVYSVSNVDLAPGFDARHDLAAAIGALGHDLQSARGQEADAIDDALRPLLIVLVALGLVTFGASAVAAGQVIQRTRERDRADGAALRTLGMVRSQVRLIRLTLSAVMAAVTVATALLTMLLVSPAAPVGPLHDLDPAQGVSIDMTVAAIGASAIVLMIALITIALPAGRARATGRTSSLSLWPANAARGPATVAGLTLAFRPDGARGGAWRQVGATALGALLLGLCATFVASASTLTETPSRYGFDADLVAVNAYGDQPTEALERAFGETQGVVAATGFTLAPLLVDGRSVPGLAATAVKGDLTPTMLQGRPPLTDGEIVVGRDTLDSIEAAVGDVVAVQISGAPGRDREAVSDPIELRIVGLATFPPVNQVGTDGPRLGVGALVTREAFHRMGGDPANEPEFTTVRVADDTKVSSVIARLPHGFQDSGQTTTTWFTGTKPAEIRQLDAAMPYLRGSLVVGSAILFAVVAHALWTRARSNRHDLAVLRALGCTRRQLDSVTAWQALPFALAAIVVGLPLGIVLGRRSFMIFAQSLAVVDDASTTATLVGALVVAVLAATAASDLASVLAARRTRAAVVLRED